VPKAFLARWYIGGGYMNVSEVVVFYDFIILTYPIPSLMTQYRFTQAIISRNIWRIGYCCGTCNRVEQYMGSSPCVSDALGS